MLKNLVKILIVLNIFLTLSPISVHAQAGDYTLLEPSVIEDARDAKHFETYARAMFSTTLLVAVILAILMFTWGGFEYIAGNIPGSKTDGKQKIWAAIFGLLIALVSWLILNTINPDLVNFRLDKIGQIGTGGTPGGGEGNDPVETALANYIPTGAPPANNSTVTPTNCSGCVSLAEQGATVANYSGITGPGRTDLVKPEVATRIINVQRNASDAGIETQITAAYTEGVGHSVGSQHYQGNAVDIQPVGGDNNPANMARLEALCNEQGFTFVLNEGNHVHCDMRPH